MENYLKSTEDVLSEVKSRRDGLTEEETDTRLNENGKNKLAEGKKESLFVRFVKQLLDPMAIILLVAAGVSGIIAIYQNESPADVFIILIVVLINAVLGVYQENKAEKAIEALNEMAAATSKVIRSGNQITIKSEDVVIGDISIFEHEITTWFYF